MNFINPMELKEYFYLCKNDLVLIDNLDCLDQIKPSVFKNVDNFKFKSEKIPKLEILAKYTLKKVSMYSEKILFVVIFKFDFIF